MKPESEQMELPLKVKLESFEGPLDLLLFLIRKNEIDIYDIPIAVITQQYLEYLESHEKPEPGRGRGVSSHGRDPAAHQVQDAPPPAGRRAGRRGERRRPAGGAGPEAPGIPALQRGRPGTDPGTPAGPGSLPPALLGGGFPRRRRGKTQTGKRPFSNSWKR